MTGYQSAPTLENAVAQHSTIGGLLYGILGPTLEGLLKQHLGINPQVSMFDPRSSRHHKVQSIFKDSDLRAAEDDFKSYDALFGAKQGKTFFHTLYNVATNKLSGQDAIASDLYKTMLDAGIRNSWVNSGRTIRDMYNMHGGMPVVTQQNIYDFFNDAIHTGSPGISKAEKAELTRNYIRSNFTSLAGYSTMRNTEWEGRNDRALAIALGVKNGIIYNRERNGYTVNEQAYDAIDDLVSDLNKELGDEKLTDKLEYNGQNKRVKTLLHKLKSIDDTVDEDLISFSTDSEGKVNLFRGVKDSLNKLDKEIGNYFNAVKEWSNVLGTSLEGSSAALNNMLGMDYAATFKGNHKVVAGVARTATHTNALSGKGDAFTQTSIHAAASILKQMGGDAAGAFITGQRAALYFNPYGNNYRVNGETLDMYNVALSAGFQEAETSKLYASMFAAGGYANTEEGRKQFWEDIQDAHITNNNLNFQSALAFANKRAGKKGRSFTAAEFHSLRKDAAALDFLAVDNEAANRNADQYAQYAEKSIISAVGGEDSKLGALLKSVLSMEGNSAKFWDALGSNADDRREKFKKLGLNPADSEKIGAALIHATENDATMNTLLRTANGSIQVMARNLSDLPSRRLRQREVEKRAAVEKILKDVKGDTISDKLVNLSKSSNLSLEDFKDIAAQALTATEYSSEVISGALVQDTKKDPDGKQLRERIATMATNLKIADEQLDTKNTGIVGSEARSKILKAVKDGSLDSKTASRMLTSLGIHGAEFDEKGTLNKIDYSSHTDYEKDTGIKNAREEMTAWMNSTSATGLSKEQVDRIIIQNNKDIRSEGTTEEKELAAARLYATKEWSKTQDELSVQKKKALLAVQKSGVISQDASAQELDAAINHYFKVDGDDVKSRSGKELSEQDKKGIKGYLDARKNHENAIALTQKLGVKGGRNRGKELDYTDSKTYFEKGGSEQLQRVKEQHNRGIQSAAESAGISMPTGEAAILEDIVRILRDIFNNIKK